MKRHTIRCNWCEWTGCEQDLVGFDDGDEYEYGYGCPVCETDEYLTDIIDVEKYNE